MQSGDLDCEEILEFYQRGIVIDRLRIELYAKVGLHSWLAFTLAKRAIYVQEMQENEFPIDDLISIDPTVYA